MKGWRRLGIVLSVFWFFGFGWWLRGEDFEAARKAAGYDHCSIMYDIRREAPDFGERSHQVVTEFHDCLHQAGERFMSTASPWWGIIVADVLSIGALWLLAWLVVAVGRWVAAGFRKPA